MSLEFIEIIKRIPMDINLKDLQIPLGNAANVGTIFRK